MKKNILITFGVANATCFLWNNPITLYFIFCAYTAYTYYRSTTDDGFIKWAGIIAVFLLAPLAFLISLFFDEFREEIGDQFTFLIDSVKETFNIKGSIKVRNPFYIEN